MKIRGGMEVQLQSFLISAIYESDCSSSRAGRFIPGKEGRYASEYGLVAVGEGKTHYPGENPKHDSCASSSPLSSHYTD
jgi:hypothetical protein